MDNPAFPQNDFSAYAADRSGMTIRDWFAGQALLGIAGYFTNLDAEEMAEEAAKSAVAAYLIADAMLAERSKPTESAASMQRVAYFDEGEFHWMSGIAPRDCELYAERAKDTPSHG